MKYKVITKSCSYNSSFMEQDIKKFEQQVNKAIQEGWKPIGGISPFSDYYVMQALIKEN